MYFALFCNISIVNKYFIYIYIYIYIYTQGGAFIKGHLNNLFLTIEEKVAWFRGSYNVMSINVL